MQDTFKSLARDVRGANFVEYIILVGLIALVGFAGFKYFGSMVQSKIQQQGASVNQVQGNVGP